MAGLPEIQRVFQEVEEVANVEIDHEWVKLISEARSLGFKKEEISAFFKRESLEVTLEENDGK
ncbi:DNA-binding anti-repressor SinI [Bacillus sp. ISL-34]|nr:DNA-binding anti-repressor SinI [Bacillus sp. ISL-34]